MREVSGLTQAKEGPDGLLGFWRWITAAEKTLRANGTRPVYSLQRIRTDKGVFSHSIQLFCRSQLHGLSLLSTDSKSKAQIKCASISRISRYARLRPKHLRGPRENGLKADGGDALLVRGFGLSNDGVRDSQREGTNFKGELGKLSLERFDA